MSITTEAILRQQLTDRQAKLAHAVRSEGSGRLTGLLLEVDRALERFDAGNYGLCDSCHESIEADRLLSDPLTRFCLGCLTPEEVGALQRDLDTAAAIQVALLPRRNQVFAGWQVTYEYEPLGAVSGDYCDVIQSRRDLYFLFGDVAGKGVSASLLMTHLHALFRSLIGLDLPLAEMMTRANSLFAETTLPTSYATLLLGRASEDGRMELCNAGHCPPLLVSSSQVSSVDEGGVPFGLFASAGFESVHLRLEAGETLFLYTDGLSEARDGSGEEYGRHRLRAMLGGNRDLSAEALAQGFMTDFREFSQGSSRFDDLAFLILRRL